MSAESTTFLAWSPHLAGEVRESGLSADGWRQVEFRATAASDGNIRGRWALGRIANPFWCLPGLFWGDNRQDRTPMLYPRFDAARTTPAAFTSSFWQFHVSRLSQPVAACHDGRHWHILEIDPYVPFGNGPDRAVSMGFAYEEGCAFLTCALPAAEEPYRHTGTDYTHPRVETCRLAEGESLTWSYRVHVLPGSRAGLLDFLENRYHEQRATALAEAPRTEASAIARATRNGLMNWHHEPALPTFKYAVAYDRIAQQIAEGSGCTLDQGQMHLGWTSGWVIFKPLLDYAERFKDTEAWNAAINLWTRLSASATSPSGFWWSRHVPRRRAADGTALPSLFDGGNFDGWDGGWLANPRHLHLRTTGDAMLRALQVIRRHGKRLPFHDSLLADIRRQAQLMAGFARDNPILPLSVDALSGEIQALHGTAAMIWISVWVLLDQMGLWDDRDLIHRCAEAYRPSVEEGLLYGAPEDVGQSMTSEDVYIALNVYADLFAQYRRPEDLATLEDAARWLYLWRRAFNVRLSPRTLIGAYGLRSHGGDLASAKNNHLHVYGVDAEEALKQLSEWTGNPRWAGIAEDHWRFLAQLVSLEDGHFNGYEGMVTEQFYFIDWACLGNSVQRNEPDPRKSTWDTGPHFRNHGNLAGFSTAWCVAFAMQGALNRISPKELN
jgi:hypothetical protein